jgi:hypothetical protein
MPGLFAPLTMRLDDNERSLSDLALEQLVRPEVDTVRRAAHEGPAR